MKQFLLALLAVVFLVSCDDDDDVVYHFEYVPVLEAEVPEEFEFGRVYELIVTYELPNSCYDIYSYDYIYEGTSRIIAPIAIVDDSAGSCAEMTTEGTFTVRVEALQAEDYLFKFWQGEDEEGEPIYLEIEVPVI